MLVLPLSITFQAILHVSSSLVETESIPYFPNMVCESTITGDGTCTAYDGYCFYSCNAGTSRTFDDTDASFTFGPLGGGTCASSITSNMVAVNATFVYTAPSQLHPRKPQATSTIGYGLGNGYCILNCDASSLNYEYCPKSGAEKAYTTLKSCVGTLLIGVVALWIGGLFSRLPHLPAL